MVAVAVAADALSGGGGFGASKPRARPRAATYTKAALEKACDRFEAVKAGKGSFVVDVYGGAPGGSKLFFVGKVAHDLKTPPECAIAALAPLLAPHARFLQPLLEGRGDLDWFVAPGDTEVEVAKGERPLVALGDGVAKASHDPGFSPEWYEAGEDGFYVRRDTAAS